MPPRGLRRRSVRFNLNTDNIVDSNNNVESDTDTAPIELSLSDGTEVAIGAIVWIKHNQCLDTPVIIQHIFDDERAEVRNLIDNTVIILNGRRHLTESCKTFIENKRIAEFGTLALFNKYQCRIAIENVTTAIQDVGKRLQFCKETLPKILIDSKEKNWFNLSRRLTKELSEEILNIVMKLYYQIRTGNDSIAISKYEAQSIAAKILQDKRDNPVVLPNGVFRDKPKKIGMCSVCHRASRSLQKCTTCASAFHKSCHRNNANVAETECRQCLAHNVPNNIVYTYTSKQWWPAIIISPHQVPREIFEKRKEGPGLVFMFIVGKYEYEQALVSNLLVFQIDNALRDAILKRDDNSLNSAVEIAAALDVE